MGCGCSEDREKELSGRKSSAKEKKKLPHTEPNSKKSSVKQSTASPTKKNSNKNAQAKASKNISVHPQKTAKKLKQSLTELYTMGEPVWPGTKIWKAIEKVTKISCFIFEKPRIGSMSDRVAWVSAIRGFDHPHIVRIQEVLQEKDVYYVITEPLSSIRLCDYLQDRGNMPEVQVAAIMRQVLLAVSYCHSQGVILRALNSEQVVIVKERPILVKLFGFEEACPDSLAQELSHSLTGSPFVAPETRNGYCCDKSDIWSCGILAYFLLGGMCPSDINPSEVKSTVTVLLKSRKWKQISNPAKDFIESALNLDTLRRPTAAACLAHPWLLEKTKESDLKGVRDTLRNMQDAQENSEIKSIISRFIIDKIVNSEKFEKLAEAFNKMDADGSGTLSQEELEAGLKRVFTDQKATAEAERIMLIADRNKSGRIDYTEFLQASYGDKNLFSNENLITAFNSLDRDRSGRVSLAELKIALNIESNEPSEKMWNALMSSVDATRDGEIDFKEFTAIVKKSLKKAE